MRFENPTKWELFLDGFHNFWNCLDCYNDGDDSTIDQTAVDAAEFRIKAKPASTIPELS